MLLPVNWRPVMDISGLVYFCSESLNPPKVQWEPPRGEPGSQLSWRMMECNGPPEAPLPPWFRPRPPAGPPAGLPPPPPPPGPPQPPPPGPGQGHGAGPVMGCAARPLKTTDPDRHPASHDSVAMRQQRNNIVNSLNIRMTNYLQQTINKQPFNDQVPTLALVLRSSLAGCPEGTLWAFLARMMKSANDDATSFIVLSSRT